MDNYKKALQVFKGNGGILRAAQARRLQVHSETLSLMKNRGVLEQIGKGLYRLADMPPLSQPDIITVALKIPQGVLCLISALAFHEITTQIPHEVTVALRSGAEKPRIAYPPTRYVWLSDAAYNSGIEVHEVDGVKIRVYSPEKTVTDCFKFRNKIGLDVAIEALKLYRSKKHSSIEDLLKYATINRVAKVMKPYLESII